MSEDPISKSQIGAGMGKSKIIPESKGSGQIYTNRDYSEFFPSLRARIIYLTLCLLPYVGICIFVYLEGIEVLGIILLAVPLFLFTLFWILKRILKS